MNGDINPDPAVELLAQSLWDEGHHWNWADDEYCQDREYYRQEAAELLEKLDALRAQTDQNSAPGTTTLRVAESG